MCVILKAGMAGVMSLRRGLMFLFPEQSGNQRISCWAFVMSINNWTSQLVVFLKHHQNQCVKISRSSWTDVRFLIQFESRFGHYITKVSYQLIKLFFDSFAKNFLSVASWWYAPCFQTAEIKDSRFCLFAFSPNILIIYPCFNVRRGDL